MSSPCSSSSKILIERPGCGARTVKRTFLVGGELLANFDNIVKLITIIKIVNNNKTIPILDGVSVLLC